jgi:hypothetical protein
VGGHTLKEWTSNFVLFMSVRVQGYVSIKLGSLVNLKI